MGKVYRITVFHQDWNVWSLPRLYFQCEGHEPTLLLIKTTQKEVSRNQREPGVLASEFWGFCCSCAPGRVGTSAASTQPSCA